MTPKFTAIAAFDENRVIGYQNQLPWHLPADMKHFKTLTSGHTIIMGRKTFASIGKALPNRRNIILTRDANFTAPNCEIVNSIGAALTLCQTDGQVFIIGGAEIYQLFLPFTDSMQLTLIHHAFKGDAYFPDYSHNEWQQTALEAHAADHENPYPYSFLELTRIKQPTLEK